MSGVRAPWRLARHRLATSALARAVFCPTAARWPIRDGLSVFARDNAPADCAGDDTVACSLTLFGDWRRRTALVDQFRGRYDTSCRCSGDRVRVRGQHPRLPSGAGGPLGVCAGARASLGGDRFPALAQPGGARGVLGCREGTLRAARLSCVQADACDPSQRCRRRVTALLQRAHSATDKHLRGRTVAAGDHPRGARALLQAGAQDARRASAEPAGWAYTARARGHLPRWKPPTWPRAGAGADRGVYGRPAHEPARRRATVVVRFLGQLLLAAPPTPRTRWT